MVGYRCWSNCILVVPVLVTTISYATAEDVSSELVRNFGTQTVVDPGIQTVDLFPNEVKLLKFAKPFSTVIVGEPRIAEATAQAEWLILTGKSPGRTSVIVLDSGNNVLLNRRITVSEFAGMRRVSVNSASHKDGSLQTNISVYGCPRGRLCELAKSPEGVLSSLPKGSSVNVPVGAD